MQLWAAETDEYNGIDRLHIAQGAFGRGVHPQLRQGGHVRQPRDGLSALARVGRHVGFEGGADKCP